jgi:uncharacterized protein (TIGR00369 family)
VSGRAPDDAPHVDPELRELIKAGSIAYWETLGIRLVDAEVGRVRLRLPMSDALATFGRRVMHGGAIASIIDAAAASAVRTLRKPGEPQWRGLGTTDLNVSYLEAATGDIEAEGRVLREGRAIAFVQVDVENADGRVIAVGRATLAIRRADEGAQQ